MIGTIHMHYGPMGSDKSAALIDAEPDCHILSMHYLAFKPVMDTRIAAYIESRKYGKVRRLDAMPISSIHDMQDAYWAGRISLTDFTIFIDDAHMLVRHTNKAHARALLVLCLEWARRGHDVHIGTLDIGHHGHLIEPYVTFRDAQPRYHQMIQLHAHQGRCSECMSGGPSTHSWLIPDLEEAISGDLGTEYYALCHFHFWRRMDARLEDRKKYKPVSHRLSGAVVTSGSDMAIGGGYGG